MIEYHRITALKWLDFNLEQRRYKGGFMSEKSGVFLLLQFLQTYTPKNYPKLLHPVYGIDKILVQFNIF